MYDRLMSAAISGRLLILVLALMLMVAGYIVFTNLPVEAFPDVSPNLVQVFTETEGLAPEEIEKFVTFPVESAMNGLPGVREIRSVSNFGLSVVNVYFDDNMDIYFARQLVNERLAEAREGIPEGFGEPDMGPISTGMGLILFYYLEDEGGTRSLEELRSLQDWVIKRALQALPGVTEVLGIGGHEKQYHVVPDPEALIKYRLTIAELVAALRDNNLNVGAQFIERNAEEYVINARGLATGIDDLERIVLRSVDGTPVYLRDVASVAIGGGIRRGVQTRNGEREVIAGMVVKLVGTNSSDVIASVEQAIGSINQTLPAGVRIVPYYEQRTLVQAAVNTVSSALVQGIVLVVLVLFAFLGSFRGSVVAAVAIPFSVLFASIGMEFFGLSANLMSLGGLAIAIGMLVDGAIVMVENIDRRLRLAGDEPLHRRIASACAEVVRPVAFAALIVVIVFLPLFSLQGVEGKTFRPLAYTLALAMSGSLVFALLIVPALSAYTMRPPRFGSKIAAFYARFEQFTHGLYRPVVSFMIDHRFAALLLIVIFTFAGAFAFFNLGSEFTPELEEGTMVLRLTMAPSISLNESTRVTLQVEQRLMAIPEVASVVSRIGRGEVGAHTDPINSAEMYIGLKPRSQWRGNWSQEELEAAIRADLGAIPGVLTNFTQPIAMTVDELLEGIRAELAVKLHGEDLAVLADKAQEIAAVLRAIAGAEDVQVEQIAGTPQLTIDIDREAIARYGLNVADVQETIRTAIGGSIAGEIFEGVRRFPIVVRYPEAWRNTPEVIGRLTVPAPGGARVLLADVAHIAEIVGPRQIMREDGQRFITVQCNVDGRDIGGFVQEAEVALRQKVRLAEGYSITWGGQFRLQQEANARFALVIPITLLLICVLLYSSLNNLRQTGLILVNIPLALVGGAVALWLTGQNLSVPSSIGFISLFGIAIGNGLVLVTAVRQQMEEGMEPAAAVIQGSVQRLRPVLMTALTTALGLLPLLFADGTGSEVQRPLATVVIGGLFTATAMTLLVLPALYHWFGGRSTNRN